MSNDKKALLEKLQADRYSVSKCIEQNQKLKEMLTDRENEIKTLVKNI